MDSPQPSAFELILSRLRSGGAPRSGGRASCHPDGIAHLRTNLVKTKEALWAQLRLRRCTEVGPLTRLAGRVVVRNSGTLRLGSRVKLWGKPVPIELVALPGAELLIGEGTFINRGVSICAQESIRIGRDCLIGNDCLVFDTDFHNPVDRDHAPEAAPVRIGDGVWLAARCIVLKGVTIGEGAVVCAGAVVVSDVPPFTVVGGVPAQVIKTLASAPGPLELPTSTS